jgi:hypothetical protein
MNIGSSISEAIDWTQDQLHTTRPLAERTLFSLMACDAVDETEQGFVLLEDDDEELEKHHRKVKNHFSQNWKQYKFNGQRKNFRQLNNLNDRRQRQLAKDSSASIDTEDAASVTDSEAKNALS